MKFEDIESTWALQQPAKTGSVDIDALKRSLTSQLKRRQGVLVVGLFATILGLIMMQVFFFLNLSGRADDKGVFLVRLLLHQGVNLVILGELIRIFIRHRRLARGRAGSVREVVTLSLASVEGEMTDYRMAKLAVPVLIGLALFSAYLNQPVSRVGWEPFLLRVGLVFALMIPVSLVLWRHYRRILEPEHARLMATVGELDSRI